MCSASISVSAPLSDVKRVLVNARLNQHSLDPLTVSNETLLIVCHFPCRLTDESTHLNFFIGAGRIYAESDNFGKSGTAHTR